MGSENSSPMNDDDDASHKHLDEAISAIVKRYGQGSISILKEDPRFLIEVIPTGSLSLDIALGVGGLPRGRVTEIYGPESSGKTTISLHVAAETQRRRGTAAYIDTEHSLDPLYANRCGVDIDRLLISQPDTGEQAFEIAETLIRSGRVGLVVIDSVAALVPRAEIEGDMGDATGGMHSRLMAQALRKLSGPISVTKTCVIFTNQLRQRANVIMGNPETTTGGSALKHYASIRIDCRRIQAIKMGDEIIGARVRARVVKNKVAPPFRTAEFDILFSQGIDKAGSVFDLASTLDIIQKNGSVYKYNGISLGRGRERAINYLRDNQSMASDLEIKIRDQVFIKIEK